MSFFDLAKFDATRLSRVPFDHLVVPGFLKPTVLDCVRHDFPRITRPGLFPLQETAYGEAFGAMIDDLRAAPLTGAFSDKFGIDLSPLPLMITVRGHCQKNDGRIHTDSESKVVTALLYLNSDWHDDRGRLRLLRGPSDLDDKIAEVAPLGGTLVAFRRSENSWHGHEPYEGERRYIMFNWMTSAGVAAREVARHRLSAKVKRYLSFA